MKSKSIFPLFLVVMLTLTSIAAAPPPPPQPNVTITVINGLPANMNVGETYSVEIQITSDVPFISAMVLPDIYYPGRYVVAHGVDHEGAGTSAILSIPFTAKSSTIGLPGGVAPVAVVAGVRFQGGVVVSQRFDYQVAVP